MNVTHRISFKMQITCQYFSGNYIINCKREVTNFVTEVSNQDLPKAFLLITAPLALR